MPGLYQILGWSFGAALFLFFVLLIYSVTPHNTRREKAKRFKNRAPMSGDEFYASFYATSGIPKAVVVELRREIADAVEVPVALLRPSDRFEHELKDLWNAGRLGGASGELFEMDMCALDRAERLGLQLPPGGFETVDDYVQFFGHATWYLRPNPARTSSSFPAAPCG